MQKKLYSLLAVFVTGVLLLSSCGLFPLEEIPESDEVQSHISIEEPDEWDTYKELPYFLKELSDEEKEALNSSREKDSDSAKKLSIVPLDSVSKTQVMSIQLPQSYTFEPLGDIFVIYSDGIAVGECRFNFFGMHRGTKKLFQYIIADTDSSGVSSVDLQCDFGEQSWQVPVYRIYVKDNARLVTAVIFMRREILCDEQALDIANSMSYSYLSSALKAGQKDLPTEHCQVLILGNSFIYTSDIQESLTQMGKDNNVMLSVSAYSYGNATVATFEQNEYIRQILPTNHFDYIFLCGFYGDYDMELSVLLYRMSAYSQMVIFPAHNEPKDCPYRAFQLFDKTGLADWKGLLDGVIADGIAPGRLHEFDYHHHTTRFGGYAGACLVYSYIYGEKPGSGSLDASFIEEQALM